MVQGHVQRAADANESSRRRDCEQQATQVEVNSPQLHPRTRQHAQVALHLLPRSLYDGLVLDQRLLEVQRVPPELRAHLRELVRELGVQRLRVLQELGRDGGAC